MMVRLRGVCRQSAKLGVGREGGVIKVFALRSGTFCVIVAIPHFALCSSQRSVMV